ncbi:MAG: SMP-30/gluconolactonase/LRE family protein [Ideonella sp.]|nr:SMP-30/gluconolactonase/LRE family protein [Ideonella sp.]
MKSIANLAGRAKGVVAAMLLVIAFYPVASWADRERQIELVSQGPYSLAENPVWNENTRCLLFADIHRATIHEYCPETGKTYPVLTGLMPFGLTINDDGALIVGTEKGLYYVASATDIRPLATNDPVTGGPIWVNEQVAVNGGIYFGGVNFDGVNFGPGNLYWIGPDGSVKRVATDRRLPNGLGVSPDQTKLYFAASVDRKIYRFDINPATGELSNEITFAELPCRSCDAKPPAREEDQCSCRVGIYDGLTVNAAGDVLVAVWYDGVILRYRAKGKVGKLVETIEVPDLQVSNLTFGGKRYRDLYITTASTAFINPIMPCDFDPALPMNGNVYRLRMPVPGLPESTSRISAPRIR